MKLVHIIKSWSTPDLMRQTPGGLGVWGDCRFTLDPVVTCDYLVVLNRIPKACEISVPTGNVWAFIQEPPINHFRCFEKGFSQFDKVHTQERRLRGPRFKYTHGSLPWHINRSYEQLRSEASPVKSKSLSWITSSLGVWKGHRRRLDFLAKLKTTDLVFDLFGRGFTAIDDKWDGLAPYEYAIAVENHSGPDYWTEKIADCFLSETMPLYFGATNIDQYFPSESYIWIDIDDPKTPVLIKEILRSGRAKKHRDAILEAKRRILEEHNLFPRIAGLIAERERNQVVGKPVLRRFPETPDLSGEYEYMRFWPRLKRKLTRTMNALRGS